MSRLLLDTHVFVWAKTGERELAPAVRSAIVDPENEVFVSLATAWELLIKAAAGKLEGDPGALIGSRQAFERALLESNFLPLAIAMEHIFVSGALPLHHRDPFDRMIIAQAITEGLTVVTVDQRFGAYRGLALLCAI